MPSTGVISRKTRRRAFLSMFLLGTAALILKWIVLPLFYKNILQLPALLSHQCGENLPFCEKSDEFQLERVRFAALKVSKGDLRELQKAVKLAHTDWRDLLMAAGFGHDVSA